MDLHISAVNDIHGIAHIALQEDRRSFFSFHFLHQRSHFSENGFGRFLEKSERFKNEHFFNQQQSIGVNQRHTLKIINFYSANSAVSFSNRISEPMYF